MSEYLKRVYHKEEEFLDAFFETARSASLLLSGEWEPNYWCNDKTRHHTQSLLSTGGLRTLTFDSASIYQDKNGFSSAEIVLKSSTCIVTVRVKKTNGKFVAEKIAEQKKLPINNGKRLPPKF